MKLGWHGDRASGAPEEALICDSRADMSLASSEVSPATMRQIGEFQRTSESSSDNRVLRVIARTNASTRRSRAAGVASAANSGGGEGDSVAAGAEVAGGSDLATIELHNAASTATLQAAQWRPIDPLNKLTSMKNRRGRQRKNQHGE
jgi:hypothetical protein